LDVNKNMLVQLFCNSELCTGEVDDEGRCDVDLRSLVDDFKNADPDQFLSDVFEVEVVDRLSKEQKVRFLFELKERSVIEMEVVSEEEEEEEKYEEMAKLYIKYYKHFGGGAEKVFYGQRHSCLYMQYLIIRNGHIRNAGEI
jgi:hypothetical protein